ncbi:chaperonin-like RbcX protein [Actinidia rufa]|uniref:Chaperonin-like RbcX protein n=1 Tax=Actinidia rufa TaxID=165716 RepID=A0A7J0HDA4_9ERIC|nr:chaperonin-like RbcX protein [Actinidia rufa]
MVGALSIVGSSVVDSHTSPYLCLDALPSSNLIHRNSGDLMLKRNSNDRKKHLVIRSSFTGSGYQWRPFAKANSKKLRRARSLFVVNELAGQYEDSFEDVKSVRNFVAANKPGDGKRFIRTLVKDKQELAERVMVTRLHLYGKWVKKCNHAEIYNEISDQNLELMRERLMETVIWPSDDTNMEKIG